MSKFNFAQRYIDSASIDNTDGIILDVDGSDVPKRVDYSDFLNVVGGDITIASGALVFVTDKADLPTATVAVPVVFAFKELYPTAVLLLAVVFANNSSLPIPIFPDPVVLLYSA